MARELNIRRLLATTAIALTVTLSLSSTSTSSSMALAKPEEGNGRIPGTLPSGAPIKMPELDSLSVTLPFSLRKQLGLTNITDVVQSFAPGAFCEASSTGNCDNSGQAEKATQSKHSFHDLQGGVPNSLSLQHVLEATDETFLLFVYDSLDANSYRNAAMVDEAAGLLKGYVTTVGIDIRRDDLQWLLNTWNIQLAPSLRLLRPTRMMATTKQGLTSYEAIASTAGNAGSHLLNNLNAVLSPSYSLLAGVKNPIDIAPNGNQMAMMRQEAWSVDAIRKFALGGGKSLDSENSIETLSAGDSGAETVYDVLRGVHPLTFIANELLAPSTNSWFDGLINTASVDDFSAKVLTSSLYTRRAQVPKAVVILFTDKDGALTNILKALALRYNNRAVFMTVNGKEQAPKLAQAFGITSYPSFAVVKPPQASLSHAELKDQLVSGAFSKTRKTGEDVFSLISGLLKKDANTLRVFTPPAGQPLSVNKVMAFMDQGANGSEEAAVPSISLSGIIPSEALHTLQRQATREAYYYQQQRVSNLITPVSSRADWDNLVFAHAGLVASGPMVSKPASAPIITVSVLFTPTAAEPSQLIKQEVSDVRGRLKDNYFVSIPKAKAAETLKYFKEQCRMPDEAEASEEVDPTTTDVVFLYARLQPLSADAAKSLGGSNIAASAAYAPNFIIDYSCRTPDSAEETGRVLSSAMKMDKLVHYGAKKGFLGFGGSEQPAPSFDWSKVPQPKL
eukprot:GILI01014897.1.p1 GENE.GILI01014897.1~~GILI01014897.1.p1  ORF type:complete len:733 (+),score=188.42 GILI01014897.1:71-2269(+)